MALTAGTKLGPYEITFPLGAGGMGEVYLAQDTRLGRSVAIKILPDPTGKQMIQALSLDGSENIRSFLQGSFNVSGPHFSPDGRWVAYTTDESGQREVCVQPFPGFSGKWMISTEGGQYPRWVRNGREIIFFGGDQLMSAEVEIQAAFKAGTPHSLFQATGYLGAGNYDVTADGQHFLMIKQEDAQTSPKELRVILNWSEELKRRAPSGKR